MFFISAFVNIHHLYCIYHCDNSCSANFDPKNFSVPTKALLLCTKVRQETTQDSFYSSFAKPSLNLITLENIQPHLATSASSTLTLLIAP